MRILIIEDNPRKLNDTMEYVMNVAKEIVEMDHAGSVKEAYGYFKEHKYDRIIIDMQLPSSNISSIDRFGGIAILQRLEACELNADTKRVVNSSSGETREVLNNNGYEKEVLIVNSSMYDCTKAFDKFINGVVGE